MLCCTASPCTDSGLTAGAQYPYTLTVTDSAGDREAESFIIDGGRWRLCRYWIDAGRHSNTCNGFFSLPVRRTTTTRQRSVG